MKTFIITLFVILLVGCSAIKSSKPILNVYGESDYIYMRVGLMWCESMTNYITNIDKEDFLRGDIGSEKNSRKRGGSNTCSGGSCRD